MKSSSSSSFTYSSRVDSKAYLNTSASSSVTRSALEGFEWIRLARTLSVLNKKCGLICACNARICRAPSLHAIHAASIDDDGLQAVSPLCDLYAIVCSCSGDHPSGAPQIATSWNPGSRIDAPLLALDLN